MTMNINRVSFFCHFAIKQTHESFQAFQFFFASCKEHSIYACISINDTANWVLMRLFEIVRARIFYFIGKRVTHRK